MRRYRQTPLGHFMQHPRSHPLERWLQMWLVKIAACVTRLRGLQSRDQWWILAPIPGWQALRLGIVRLAFGIGLIHASLSLIATAKNQNGTGSTISTLDTTTSLNLAAGDVLVDWCKHEGATTTFATAKTTGGNDGTFDAGDKVTHSNGDLECSFGYRLSTSADGTHTRRLTLGAARSFVSLIVHQFRPDAGETVTKDTSNTGQGNGTTMTSGNVTTTGTDEVALGGYGEYVANGSATHRINGVAADGVVTTNPTANFTAAWYRLLTATFSGGNASCTNSSSGDWICNVIALKSEAGGGTLPVLEVSPLFIMGMG